MYCVSDLFLGFLCVCCSKAETILDLGNLVSLQGPFSIFSEAFTDVSSQQMDVAQLLSKSGGLFFFLIFNFNNKLRVGQWPVERKSVGTDPSAALIP